MEAKQGRGWIKVPCVAETEISSNNRQKSEKQQKQATRQRRRIEKANRLRVKIGNKDISYMRCILCS